MFGTVVQAALGITAILLLFIIWRIAKSILIFLAIPGPPTDWLFRHEVNEFSSPADQIREFKTKWQQRYPRICRFFIGPMPYIALAHPESIKELVKHKPPKPKLYKKMLGDWLGDGLLLSSGNKWFRHRKMLTPAFHYNILNSFTSIYVKATHVMLQQWEETEQKDGYIVLQNSVPYLSLDILLQCIGSLETNCQIEKENIQYVRDVQELTEIGVKRYSHPLYIFDWYFYNTQDGRNFRRACSRSRRYTCDLIHLRKQVLLQSPEETSGQMNDFLSILLTSTDENGKGLTDEEICNEVDTFVFEGHDTTATALLWVFYYLGKFPKFQERCRKEVMGCVGENTLTIEDLSQLEFVSMFIKESLRLHPPVYSVARDTEYPITVDGYEIPKGTLVQMSLSQLHLNAEFWPDPFTFDPYRFSSENLSKVNAYAYLPFSVGERNCIGQNFAMHEMKSVVSIVLKKYEIELHPSISETTSIIHKKDILFKPETPLKFYLKEAF